MLFTRKKKEEKEEGRRLFPFLTTRRELLRGVDGERESKREREREIQTQERIGR